MCEYMSDKLTCAMKVTVVGPSGAQSAGHNPSGDRSECEHTCWDPKDGELCLNRVKPGKLRWRLVAVLTCKSIVKFGYRGERLIEPSSSWFPPKFPSG